MPLDPDALPVFAGHRSLEAAACVRLAKARATRSWNCFPQWGWVWRVSGTPYLVISRTGEIGPGSVGVDTPLTVDGLLGSLRLLAFGYEEVLGPVSALERLQVREAEVADLGRRSEGSGRTHGTDQ